MIGGVQPHGYSGEDVCWIIADVVGVLCGVDSSEACRRVVSRRAVTGKSSRRQGTGNSTRDGAEGGGVDIGRVRGGWAGKAR